MIATAAEIEETIASLELAAQLCRKTPGRFGSITELPAQPGADVLVGGDLHGNCGNFGELCRRAALDQNPTRHIVLQEICHGGPAYSDAGECMSHQLLEGVARLKVRFPERVHLLMGNHELAELADLPIHKNRRMLNLAFRQGLYVRYGSASPRVHRACLEFLATWPLACRTADGIFISHSIPEQCDRCPFDGGKLEAWLDLNEVGRQSAIFDLVWGRDYRQANADAFAQQVGARLLVNGHEPCPSGYYVPNTRQLILDCCGVQSACLLWPLDQALSQEQLIERIATFTTPMNGHQAGST